MLDPNLGQEKCNHSEVCGLTFQVSRNGMVNSVFTLYDLSNGDDTEGEGTKPLKSQKESELMTALADSSHTFRHFSFCLVLSRPAQSFC